MKKLLVRLVSLIALMGLILGLAGCCSIVKSCLQQVLILGQPQNIVNFTNTEASFTVYAVAGPPFTTNGLTYQWQVNTNLLDPMDPNTNWFNWTGPGATTSSIDITNVQLSDVGYYRVLVSAPGSTTVTSAAPYLQVIIPGSIIINGTPIAGNGGGNYCSGGPFAGYIPYSKYYTVANTGLAISAADGVPTANSRVAYMGFYGDAACGIQTISKSPPITIQNQGSPSYQFILYFKNSVPPSPRPYPLKITNFLP